MKIMERIVLGRTIYLVAAGAVLLILGVLYTIFGTEASYSPPLETAESSDAHSPDEIILPVEEPDNSYEISTVTFGGSCTTGSMLGISAYGTFNGALEENGTGYFFENLKEIFLTDDFTIAGLDAVLTDRQLEPAEKDSREWFSAPASAAGIFSDGGVDALSIEFPGTHDYGNEGYSDTEAALEAAGVYWCDSGRAVYRELDNGLTVGIYCCKFREEDAEGVKAWIAGAKEKADFIALYVSDADASSVPGESKKALLRSYADAGADLIAGTNGAALQPAEEYNGSYIVYSLGSLIDGAALYREENTVLLQAELRARDGELTGVEYRFIPCRTSEAEKTWKPAAITDETLKNDVLAFMYGENNNS